jgi:hypothetical protein
MANARIVLGIGACVTTFAGCATTTIGQVQELGGGTYSISYPHTYTTSDAAMREAVGKAGDYCHAKGQALFVVPNTGDEVRFRCVPSGEVAPASSAPAKAH